MNQFAQNTRAIKEAAGKASDEEQHLETVDSFKGQIGYELDGCAAGKLPVQW